MDPRIKPIRTEQDYLAGLTLIDELINARPGTEEDRMLDLMTELVQAYEQVNEPIEPPEPIEAIKFRMDQMGLKRRDLEPILGGRAKVSEVLNGRRPLSLAMIRRLHEELGIPADVLIGKSSGPTGVPMQVAEPRRPLE